MLTRVVDAAKLGAASITALAFALGSSPAHAAQFWDPAIAWALFWSNGSADAKTAYFFNLGSVQTRLTPEGQRAVDAAGPNTMTSDLAYKLVEEQYQEMRIIKVSQKPGDPQWTDMTINVQCTQGKIRIAKTTRGYSDRPSQTAQSDDWYQVPMGWAYFAATHACQQKPWRDAWNWTSHWSICASHPAPEDRISKECDAAITQSIVGNICDFDRAIKVGIVCLSLGREPEEVSRKALDQIFPALNGRAAR